MKVKVSQLQQNPYNTREDFGDLTGLEASIRKYGLIQPLLVRKAEEGYELVFGSRRLESLRRMSIKEADVEVREVSNEDMALVALCENVHRKDLNPVELARAYNAGLKTTGLSLHAFAQTIGESDAKIKGYLDILKLPEKILRKHSQYTVTQLISLGRLNEMSESLRIELENVLANWPLTSEFLRQIVSSCESISASILPSKRKQGLCYEIISHDYSKVPPGNAGDIRTFSDSLLQEELKRYNEVVRRTAKALKKARTAKRGIRTVYDIVHWDQRLDRVTDNLREASMHVERVREKDYYSKASKRSRKKFKTVVNKLVSGLEQILKDEAGFRK